MLQEIQEAVAKVSSRAGPAVVRIGRGGGRGAGVVMRDGMVVTNAHNLRGPQATVTFVDGRQETGRAVGVDVDADLAVLAVDTGQITPMERADDAVGTGSPVFAVTTGPVGSVRVSFGLVSSVGQSFLGPRGRRITGTIEHTAALPRGSSGGPVVDGTGRMVGINTNRLGEGFYLALPADAHLEARLGSLARGEVPVRHHLGVALAPPRAARHLRRAVGLPERDGLLVRQVEDDSPAARAGLREGDLLVAAGGRPLVELEDLYVALEQVGPQGDLSLAVVRGLDELEVVVGFGGDAG